MIYVIISRKYNASRKFFLNRESSTEITGIDLKYY